MFNQLRYYFIFMKKNYSAKRTQERFWWSFHVLSRFQHYHMRHMTFQSTNPTLKANTHFYLYLNSIGSPFLSFFFFFLFYPCPKIYSFALFFFLAFSYKSKKEFDFKALLYRKKETLFFMR